MRTFTVFLGAIVLGSCSAMPGSSPMLPNRISVLRIHPLSSYKSIFDFNFTDGSQPYAGLTYANGTLYGTTYSGGAGATGTVFKITTGGSEHVLYSFKSGKDGADPWASVTYLKGVLYGTTVSGGANGQGAVFKVTTAGSEKVIHSFKGGSDGNQPEAPLIDVSGTLYGTTVGGGPGLFGTVYTITSSGSEKVLYGFKGGSKDGADPAAGLTDVKGTLYGTTSGGGPSAEGTVFKVTTSGAEKVLHIFKGPDGSTPISSLVNVSGTLYGTTSSGGAHGLGTVFKITTSGSEKVLYSFKGGSDGSGPSHTGLTNVNGTLYGVTGSGGAGNAGTVFKVTTTGKETVLYSFLGGNDGAQPTGILALVKSTLYGTTYAGGGPSSDGTVYSISP